MAVTGQYEAATSPVVLCISVPAIPVAMPRQRHRVVRTKAGRVFAQNYTPSDAPVHTFKATCRQAAAALYDGAPLAGPLMVEILLLFPRPGRLRWKSRPMPRDWHQARPDAENCAKAVLDALTGLLWVDDKQVTDLRVQKCYAAGDEQPHVKIVVRELLSEQLPNEELGAGLLWSEQVKGSERYV